MGMHKTTLSPGQLLRYVHMEKRYLGKVCYPVQGVHSMNIRVRGCRWSSKIVITFIPCFKAKVRPINIPAISEFVFEELVAFDIRMPSHKWCNKQ